MRRESFPHPFDPDAPRPAIAQPVRKLRLAGWLCGLIAFWGGAASALALPSGPGPALQATAEPSDPAGAWRAEAAPEMVPRLEAHFEWCAGEKLFAQRDAVCEVLLLFEPDHERARRVLKYEPNDRGGWVRKKYKPREDRFPELAGEAQARLGEALAPYRERLLTRYQESWSELSIAERDALREELTGLLPDDPELREAFGQVRHPGHGDWVQAETPAAEARRGEIQARVRELLETTVEAREASLSSTEKDLGLSLATASETDVVRVLGAVEPEEVERCAQRCQAALILLGELLEESKPVPPVVVHLMPNADQLDELVARRPHLADRLGVNGQQRVGAWDPETNELFLWDSLAEQRLEEAVEQCLVWALSINHGLRDEHGWAYAGLLTYVTAAVLGDSSTLRPADQAILDPAERARREKRAAEQGERSAGVWVDALRAVSEAGAPDWGELFARPASSFSDIDRFRAAALTRFVLEAHERRAPTVFRRLADGRSTERAFQLPPGASFDDLGQRVLGWLEEAVDVPVPFVDALASASFSDRDERELLRGFDKLSRSRRAEVLGLCIEAARNSGARQVALVDEWVRGVDTDVDRLPPPTDFGAFDAEVYKGGPKRRYLDPGRSQYDRLETEIDSPGADPRPRPRRVRYEFATGKLVRGDEIEDPLHDLEGLLLGELPEQEWAEARVVQELDRAGSKRKLAEYFAHTYCDRDAFAYRGITLFDVWDSQFEHEMPDPDVRAYMIEIWDDDTVSVPLNGHDHQYWYPLMGDSFNDLRGHLLTTRSIAHLWFGGRRALERGYDNSVDLIHATIALCEEDAARVAERQEADGTNFLSEARRTITGMGNDGWNAGNERRDELIEGAQRMRAAVLRALRDAGL